MLKRITSCYGITISWELLLVDSKFEIDISTSTTDQAYVLQNDRNYKTNEDFKKI